MYPSHHPELGPARNIFHLRSLNTRVTLFTLALFVASIWSLEFYSSRVLRQDLLRLLSDQQFSTASFIATEVNNELSERLNALKKVADRMGTVLLATPAELQAFLEDRPALHTLFNGGVIAIGLDGTAMADYPLSAGRIGVNFMDRDFIVSALREGKSTIGRPVIGKTSKVPLFVMATPIRDPQGQVIGALMGVTNLDKPNFLDKITEGRYGKTGGYFLIAPQERLIVTASDKSRIMTALPAPGIIPAIDRAIQGEEYSAIYVNPSGVEVLASAKGVPLAGWFVGVTLPTKEAFTPIHTMQHRLALAAIFLTLLAGILTLLMMKRLLSPMLTAVKTLASLAKTTKDTPALLPITRQDEIGELLGAFNHLLQTLQEQRTALMESELRFRSLLEDIPSVSVQGYALDGTVLFWNRASELLYGYSPAEALGANLLDLIIPTEMREGVTGAIQQMIESGEPIPAGELLLQRKDGSRVPVFSSHALLNPIGRQPELFCLDIDLTERKQAEAETQRVLQEKTVLLKEIHHRVKNNMQVVYSLLDLQAKGIVDPATRAKFEESRNRVMSMALIHENLYRSDDLASIDFNKYLQELTRGIAETYNQSWVAIVVDMEPLALDINVGIPCGLIINELVSNCFKYAFPEGRKGEIRLGIRRDNEGNNILSVEDNGIGFPATVDCKNTTSLGLQIVNVLTRQIHGNITLTSDTVTKFSVTFPAISPNKR